MLPLFLAAAVQPDPYAIYNRAQLVWETQRYPAVVSYVVHVTAVQHGRTRQRHYDSHWFAQSGTIKVDPVSREQREHPYVPPPGFDVSIFGAKVGHVGGPMNGTGTHGDLIGVPMLSPAYDFGIAPYLTPESLTDAQIVEQIRDEFHDPAPAKVAQLARERGLPTIASVLAGGRAYSIRLQGIEPIAGHPDFHLALTPLREPQKYRLRDVWIDERTYRTDRLRSEGNFVDGGTASVMWTADFRTIAGAQYLSEERTDAPLPHWFDSVTVAFEAITSDTPHDYRLLNDVTSPIREP